MRIIGPIPGRGTVAVEVPNPETATVYLREILVSAGLIEELETAEASSPGAGLAART